MFKHNQGQRNPKRVELLNTAHIRYHDDGLNSIRLRILNVKLNRLFTHILVDVGKPIVPTNPPEPTPASITSISTQTTSKQSKILNEEALILKILNEKLLPQRRNFTKTELDKLREFLSLIKN